MSMCDNKKLFYYENPSAIQSMPDEILMQAHRLAKQKEVDEDFISLFESEIRRRGME